jgi:hypothetical protein
MRHLTGYGVSMLMTFETPDLFRVDRISDSADSHLSDNVVLLNYVNDHDSIRRAMSVIAVTLIYTYRGCAQGPPARDLDGTDQLSQVAVTLRSFWMPIGSSPPAGDVCGDRRCG